MMHPVLVLASLAVPAALSAQITIPVSIGNVPVRATIGTRGVTVGNGAISARIPWPGAGSSRSTSGTASRPSGRSSGGGTTTSTSSGGRVASRASASRLAANVLNTAEDYLGVRYTWGGESARTGFDCSGFTQYVFGQHGVRIPRTSREQARVGQEILPVVSSLIPGDLMFFDASGNDGVIDHVGIYAGDNRMIHSSSSGNGVGYDNLSSERGRFFVSRMVIARRVIYADGEAYAGGTAGPSIFSWIGKAFGGGKVQFDPPDWAPKLTRR